jgi:hypothetical protein
MTGSSREPANLQKETPFLNSAAGTPLLIANAASCRAIQAMVGGFGGQSQSMNHDWISACNPRMLQTLMCYMQPTRTLPRAHLEANNCQDAGDALSQDEEAGSINQQRGSEETDNAVHRQQEA